MKGDYEFDDMLVVSAAITAVMTFCNFLMQIQTAIILKDILKAILK